MTNNPFLIYYDLRKFTKIHFENGTNEDSHLKSAIVSDPLRDRVCFVFTNLSDEYEHQYVISFFELSYNEPTLVFGSHPLGIWGPHGDPITPPLKGWGIECPTP